jgi:hypothetical protein
MSDLVATREQRRRHYEAKFVCGLQIDDQLECGRLFDRQFGRSRAPKDTVHEEGRTARQISNARRVHDQASGFDVLPEGNHRRQSMFQRAFSNFTTASDDHSIGGAHQALRPTGGRRCDCRFCIKREPAANAISIGAL